MKTRTFSAPSRWSVQAASGWAPRGSSRAGAHGDNTMPKGFATELIHAGEAGVGVAAPLTTPIYETSTFVFESADEVVAYNEGRSSKYRSEERRVGKEWR